VEGSELHIDKYNPTINEPKATSTSQKIRRNLSKVMTTMQHDISIALIRYTAPPSLWSYCILAIASKRSPPSIISFPGSTQIPAENSIGVKQIARNVIKRL
jgi:hypothetical protein